MGTANWVREGPVRSDGDKGEALDQCQRLSGKEMRGSMVPRWQDWGYVWCKAETRIKIIYVHPPSHKTWIMLRVRPLRLQVSVAAILSTHINSGVWCAHSSQSRTNDLSLWSSIFQLFHPSQIKFLVRHSLRLKQSVLEKNSAKQRLSHAGAS